MKGKSPLFLAGMRGFTFSILLSAPLLAAPKEAGTFTAGMGRPVTGIPGQADRRAVVNVADLLQTGEAVSPAMETGKMVPDFIPLPAKRPVPSEAVGRWQEIVPSTPPQLPNAAASNGTPAPTASFFGLGDNNTAIPPDVHGAAGPNHLMVTLNTQVRIQNRTGGNISTVFLSSFWSSLGISIPFDPKALYDPYANRWMFTAVSNPQDAASSVLMGVSQTSDPSGTWNLYRIDADPTDYVWADYPSMGFNKNWIVVNVNMFTVAGEDTFIRSDNFAFNKADLYAGGTGLFTRLQDLTGGGAIAPALTYDTTVSTMYLLEDWTGNFGGAGYLRLSTITGAVGSEVYTPGVAFPSTSSRWEDLPSVGFADFAPQLGSTRKIMCNDARMQNTVYRNGALWCAHTVFLPVNAGTRSSIQWWKISPAGAVLQRGRMDDPTSNLFYAFPSLAVNKNDAVLIGYSRFSAVQFASGNYAYRISSDPANTLRNDTVLKVGEAKYDKDKGFGFNRWGDYTNTVVDPVNDIDMWTIQEYAAPRISPADRWGTWWGKIPDPSDPCSNDTLPPVVTCPSNIVQNAGPGQCTAVVNFTPTASDGCSLASLVCTPPSGSTFPVGATNVSCVATDSAGNADTCTFMVTVNDTQNPQVNCPTNISVNNDLGSCAAAVNFSPSVSDNCPGVGIVCTPPSGSSFAVGTTAVTCVATDVGGNSDSCQFTVTVSDTSKPALSCPAEVIAFRSPAQCDSVAVIFSPTASDNCPGVSFVCTPPSGSKFPLGATGVTCVATDGSGNEDSCTFNVAVHKGDLNGSGGLSGSDVVLLLNCIFQLVGNCDTCVTDLNCSGGLSASDIVLLLRAAFGAEFVSCSP